MLVSFFIAIKLNFYSLVDVSWVFSFILAVLVINALVGSWGPKSVILFLMVTLWSLRLGTHLTSRLYSHYPTEDRRYQELKEKWSESLTRNFFLFYMFQGFSVALLSIPFILIINSQEQGLSVIGYTGLALWAIGWAGESLSDKQLRDFGKNPSNKGKVCEVGFWYYSRHPNYFFEWMMWLGYGVMALSAPWGFMGLLSPFIMLYLLLKVTGVPYAEKQSLKSRGEAYRQYQKTTSAFFPWFKKV